MKYYYILIMILFLGKSESTKSTAQGPTGVFSAINLNSKTFTQLVTDRTMSVTNNTSIPTTQAMALFANTRDSLYQDSVKRWADGRFKPLSSDTIYSASNGINKTTSGLNANFSIDQSKVMMTSHADSNRVRIDSTLTAIQSSIPTNNNQLTNGAGYITGVTSGNITGALGYTPYNSTNPSGYISSVTSGNITSALGYTPVNPNGTTSQYTRGDGTFATFPSIPSAQQNSDWNSSAGVTQILNKPTIPTVPTNVSAFTNDVPYLTTVPAQSFASLTGKPTTLSGYGIATDATSNARSAISLTTTGGGSAAYNSTTGVLNIPTPTTGTVTSVGVVPGAGISIVGTSPITGAGTYTVVNTAPDQTVAINSGTNISVTGTYPTFTVTNTAPTGVTSFNGNTGALTVTTSGITEGSNLYFTNARAYAAMGLTTTGAGAATYNSSTGVLNVPTPSNGTVTSITAGTGLSGGTITGSGTISLPSVGSAGTYGSSAAIPVITTDINGRVSSVSTTSLTAVSSFNGQSGSVSATTSNIPEGSNLYFTPTRAQQSFSLTTTGSGAATLSGGNLNIPVASTGTVTSVSVTSTDFTISGSPITNSGTIVANLNASGVTAGDYMIATVNSKGIVTAARNPTFNSLDSTMRQLNTAYTISSTKYTKINVSSQISCNLSISGGQSGYIVLEKSANGSTGWNFVGKVPGSSTGTLTIGLNTTQISGAAIETILPPGWYWRLRTVGTGTFSFNGGEETTY